ncbi:MAG: PepSY domain-containing protein [Gammaproteobacteria bacterium]|nr:PepSY domain-containing protein [Gammaproteobacteria bacterium]
MKTLISLATIALILVPLHSQATGRMKCDTIDKADWLSESALEEKLVAQGWQVRRMKEDGGCWEVYGTTPEGERVEAYFHPATGEKLLVARRGKILFRAEGVE